MNVLVIGVTIFTLIYSLITFEKIHKTVATLLGATMMLLFHVLTQKQAFQAIDLNVIFLLIGMMIIVHIMSTTGVFQWVAIKVAQISKGEPLLMILLISLMTAIISAFLDNVTTVILIMPVILLLADEVEIDPIPFLILVVVASNIGGAATLIGDPPNLLIGSAANLSFNDFIVNLGPVILINLVVFSFTVRFLLKGKMHVSLEIKTRIKELNANKAITDFKLLVKSLIVLTVVLVLFLTHHILHLEVATIALFGAAVLVLWTKTEPEELFKHLEWETLFFFIGLFIMVEGLVQIGFIEVMAEQAIKLTKGDMNITLFGLLWFSSIFAAIINNISCVAALIPLVKEIGLSMSQSLSLPLDVIINPLWWALALGACLGGNGTIIGASANVVVVNLAKKNGHNITFFRFLKYGALFLFQSMIICTVYLYFRYL